MALDKSDKTHKKSSSRKTATAAPLAAPGENVTYAAKAVVFAQGDNAGALFNIRKGQIKLSVVSNSGKEAVIALINAGDYFGEGCLAGQPLRMSTATAMTACTISRIPRATVVDLLITDSVFRANSSRICSPGRFGSKKI